MERSNWPVLRKNLVWSAASFNEWDEHFHLEGSKNSAKRSSCKFSIYLNKLKKAPLKDLSEAQSFQIYWTALSKSLQSIQVIKDLLVAQDDCLALLIASLRILGNAFWQDKSDLGVKIFQQNDLMSALINGTIK